MSAERAISPDSLVQEAAEIEATVGILSEAAQKLREAANALEQLPSLNGRLRSLSTASKPKMTRIEQLTQFLVENGPMFRSDVMEKSGMPRGTISAYLTIKNFSRDEEGRWWVEEEDSE